MNVTKANDGDRRRPDNLAQPRGLKSEAGRDQRKAPSTGTGSGSALDAMLRKRQQQPVAKAKAESRPRRKS